MSLSWPDYLANCKSHLSAIARSCFYSRASWREKSKQAALELERMRDALARAEAARQELEQANRQLNERVAQLERERSTPQPLQLPWGQSIPGQHYRIGMIVLCVNLARVIGLRPTVRALKVVFAWLGVAERIPTYQTIRGWMQRVGLGRMKLAKKIKGGAWLTDCTNQIGRDRVLTVMRLRDAKMPEPGVALRREDVELLTVVPGESWTRAEVAKVYQKTAKRCGVPRGVATDGAVELREPIKTLGKPGKSPLSIRDLKHFQSNRLEEMLTHDPQYQAFTRQAGQTRSALNQTKLAHFIPPAAKVKSRFMNQAPTLKWAEAVLWHLAHPQSKSRAGIDSGEIDKKLGWVRDLAPDIHCWQRCQKVISISLKFINEQGLFRGAAVRLRTLAAPAARCSASQRLLRRTTAFIREHEKELKPGERLPMSTEILESTFAAFKQFERQHSQEGFSGLLLTFPVLLQATTREEIATVFAQVKVRDVNQWLKEKLPNTLASKRQLFYREARAKRKPRKIGATADFSLN